MNLHYVLTNITDDQIREKIREKISEEIREDIVANYFNNMFDNFEKVNNKSVKTLHVTIENYPYLRKYLSGFDPCCRIGKLIKGYMGELWGAKVLLSKNGEDCVE